MGIEINYERLEQLSIADLYALYDYCRMYIQDYCPRISEQDKYNEIRYYVNEEIQRKLNDIFLF